MTLIIGYCVVEVSTKVVENPDSSIIFIMFLVLVPLFLYSGILISHSNLSPEIKIYVITLLYGIVPLGVTLPIYTGFPEYQYFFKYFVVLPPFAMIIWAFMSLIPSSTNLYNVTLMIVCITIATPVGFILPLIYADILNPVFGYLLFSILVIAPILILVYYLYIKIKVFFKLNKKEKISLVKNIEFYYPTIYIIMSSFVFGEAALIYYYYKNNGEPYAMSGLLGMILFLPIAYTMSSVTLQIDLNNDLTYLNQRNLFKAQFFGFICWVILVPIFVILLLSLESLGDFFTGTMKGLASSISILFLIFIGLVQAKFHLKQFGQIVSNIGNFSLWVFIVVPICVILPISLTGSPSSKTRNKYINIVIIYLGFFLMLVVTVASIIYNIFQKKMEADKLAKKCCTVAESGLGKRLIKIDVKTLRGIYSMFEFYEFNFDKYFPTFSEEYCWDDVLDLEEIVFQKEVITVKEFKARLDHKNKENTLKENTKKAAEKKKPSMWLQLRCFEIYPSELEKPPKVTRKRKRTANEIVEIDLVDMAELPQEEFQQIRPPVLNGRLSHALTQEFPSTPAPVINPARIRTIKSSASLKELTQDRSLRIDWLNSLFNYIANEPSEISNKPWLSEENLFLLCRHGGITKTEVSDVQLRIIYTNLTQKANIRTIDARVFIYELIPILSKELYPMLDNIKREIKIVTEKFFPVITQNFNSLLQDISQSALKPDILQRKYSRQLTFKQNPRLGYTVDRDSIFDNSYLDSEREISSYHRGGQERCTQKKSLILSCFSKCADKLVMIGSKISKVIENRLFSLYSVPVQESDKSPEENEVISKIEHTQEKSELKDWPDVARFVEETFREVIKLDKDNSKKIKPVLIVTWSFSNFFAILSKIIEILQLSASAFRTEAKFVFISSSVAVNDSVNAVNVENNSYIESIFWTCFSIIVIYFFLAVCYFKEISAGNITRDNKGRVRSRFDPKSLIRRFLTLTGGAFYITILKILMNFYACDINVDPPIVWRTNIVCYDSYHIGLLSASILALMIYYPIATFLFPIHQFHDNDLDLKLESTFLIILSQAKLVVNGIKVFLPYQLYLEYQLLGTSIVLVLIFFYSLQKKISGENRYNLWTRYGYFFAFISNFFAYLNFKIGTTTEDNYTISGVYFGIVLLSLIGTIVYQGKMYGYYKKRVLPIMESFNENDATKKEDLKFQSKEEKCNLNEPV